MKEKYIEKYKNTPIYGDNTLPLKLGDFTLKRKYLRINEKYTIFYFKKSNDFNFWVKEVYMQKANNVKILKNIFEDEKTINYEVFYDIGRKKDICYFHILNNYNNYFAIRNIGVDELANVLCRGSFLENELHLNIQYQKQILEELKSKFNISDKKLLKLLYNNFMKKNETFNRLNCILFEEYRKKFKTSMELVENAYNNRDDIIRKMLDLPPNFKLKNTSELTLYKIVKDLYKEAIYQYRTDWLNKQSLDIFIPTLKIGIEYQGEQHYKPINFFGGEEQFQKQLFLDNKKKELCQQHGIKLIEWRFDEIISSEKLINKINNCLLNS